MGIYPYNCAKLKGGKMMKSIMKRAASAVLATALVVTSVYCGGIDASAAVKTKKITMNKKKVNLVVGKKFTLKVKKVTPKKGSKAVTYKTSKKKVCTVSKKGVITAKAKGTATITVTSKVNKKAKAKVKVVVRKKTVAPTATAATSTALVVSATPAATATATATVKPGTPSPKPTKKPTGTPKPTPTVKPAADNKPTDEVLDVMKLAYLDVAEGIKTENKDGSVTLDYSGTSYKGARWYFGTREPKEVDGEIVNIDTKTPLDLTGYSYLVIEGKGQDGIPVGENHDLKTQLLDATDHADHGGLLEIDTQDLPSQLPFAFDLTGIRQDVAAFEIYSLGDDKSVKAGPITISGVYICKDKAAYDKFKAGNKDDENKDDENTEVATSGAIDLKSLDYGTAKHEFNEDGSVTITGQGKGDEILIDCPDIEFSKVVVEYSNHTKDNMGYGWKFSSNPDAEKGQNAQGWDFNVDDKYIFAPDKTTKEFVFSADKPAIKRMMMFDLNNKSVITIKSIKFE